MLVDWIRPTVWRTASKNRNQFLLYIMLGVSRIIASVPFVCRAVIHVIIHKTKPLTADVNFYPRDALHSAVFAVLQCPSV